MAQACRSVFVKFLVKFDLEFDLKFEISDGKNLVRFEGRTFRPARKGRKFRGKFRGEISEQVSEKISQSSFQISRLFSETSFSRRAVLRFWCTQIASGPHPTSFDSGPGSRRPLSTSFVSCSDIITFRARPTMP